MSDTAPPEVPKDLVSKSVMMCLFLYPGSGHFGLGHKNRGMFFIVTFTLMTLVVVGLFALGVSRIYGSATSLAELSGMSLKDWIPFGGSLLFTLGFWVYIAVDTYFCAKRYESQLKGTGFNSSSSPASRESV